MGVTVGECCNVPALQVNGDSLIGGGKTSMVSIFPGLDFNAAGEPALHWRFCYRAGAPDKKHLSTEPDSFVDWTNDARDIDLSQCLAFRKMVRQRYLPRDEMSFYDGLVSFLSLVYDVSVEVLPSEEKAWTFQVNLTNKRTRQPYRWEFMSQ